VAVGGCYTYQYDGNGNSTLGVNRDGHLNHGLYNSLNELVQGYTESYPATATVSYGYDAAGDTTAITTPVGLTNPTDPHALNTHFQYDAQGRLTTATYLSKGALVTLTQAYNAQGQRSRQSLSSGGAPPLDTYFTYDAAGRVSQETVVTNTATGPKLVFDNLYLYTQDGRPWMFLHTDPTTTPATVPYWFTVDGQGNVVAVTDQGGAVVDRYAYNQWGRETGNDATDEEVPQQLRYRGLYYDEQPARYWMPDNRAYDPALERYLQPDANRSYVYANDNPMGGGPDERIGEGAPLGEPLTAEEQLRFQMPEQPSYVTDSDITRLESDTNPRRPIRYNNAINSLTGPEGTVRVVVAGKGGAGGDVQFFREGEQEPFLSREVKVFTSPKLNNFAREVVRGAKSIYYHGEIWIEISEPEYLAAGQFGGVRNLINKRFADSIALFSKDGISAQQFQGIRITVFDTRGRLYAYQYSLGQALQSGR